MLIRIQAKKAKTQEVEAAREELHSKLSAEQLKLKSAEKRVTDLEKQLSTKQGELGEVCQVYNHADLAAYTMLGPNSARGKRGAAVIHAGRARRSSYGIR